MYYLKLDYKIKKYNVKTCVIIISICCVIITILATFESDSKCPESNGWAILAPEILGVITTEIPCGII